MLELRGITIFHPPPATSTLKETHDLFSHLSKGQHGGQGLCSCSTSPLIIDTLK